MTVTRTWEKHPVQQIRLQKTKKTHYLAAIVLACQTSKISLVAEQLFYVPLNFDTFHINALLDTGAFSSALPIKLSNLILKNKGPSNILKSSQVFPQSTKVADGRIILVERCVQVQITIGCFQFTQEFLILKNMFSTKLGLPIFRKNKILIHLFRGLHYLPNLKTSLAWSTKYDRKLSKPQILHTVSRNYNASESTRKY